VFGDATLVPYLDLVGGIGDGKVASLVATLILLDYVALEKLHC
jgi:hypothetical protein